MADGGRGQAKLDQVEKSINAGDAKSADNVLKTITDPIDQHIFKDALQRHCTAKDGLPACTIDGDGIHFGGPNKLTITDKDGKLGARDDSPSTMQRIKDGLSALADLPGKIADSARQAADGTALGDALKRSTTEDSEQNRRWNAQIKKAEGEK